MSDPRRRIAQRFQSPAQRVRYYGNVITRIDVSAVRCHTRTIVEIVNPITVFSGLNGCGKSTVLQLAAAAFSCSSNWTISQFIRKSRFDDPPVSDRSQVSFQIQTDRTSSQTLTLSYNAESRRWSGYGRRPKRHVFFAGVGFFLPRSEKQDFVFLDGDAIDITETIEVAANDRNWATRILSSRYDKIIAHGVEKGRLKDTVLQVERNGVSYSEAQMGCGEARIHFLIWQLESLPEKSLIMLEEPENSLHPSAQYALGTYLLDLVERKGHQVFMTTHSEMLMRALPQDSLIYLHKSTDGIAAIPGLTSVQARSLLSEGYEKALTVFVEDEAAELVLTELLGHHNPAFLKTIDIRIHGVRDLEGNVYESGKDSIRRTMQVLRTTGLRVAAVLDGDDSEGSDHFVFKLPGSSPPEIELLQTAAVQEHIERQYQIDRHQLMQELQGVDCHRFFRIIGEKTSRRPDHLIAEAARVYAATIPASDAGRLVSQLTEATH
jgi:predicted ATPase